LADPFIRYRTLIIAPSQSGKYVFQTTMIESGWFESVEPEILHKFDLTVVAYENKPVAFLKTEA
jgi:hypothetical protein